jgi:signal peptidase I
MTEDVSPGPAQVSAPGAALRRLGDRALTVAAVLGGLSLVTAIVLALSGITPLIVTSGSMSPGMPTGSLALSRTVAVEELAVGDVVSVLDSRATRVTHRVVSIGDDGLTLQGDANPSPDAPTYDVESADRVIVSLPHAGTALAVASGPVGRGALLGVAALALLALVWHRPGARPRRAESIAVVAALATVAGVGVGVARAPEGTSASWTDSVSGASTITSAVGPAALTVSCSASAGTVTISWSAVPGATSYEITVAGATPGERTTTGRSVTVANKNTGGADFIVPNGNRTYPVTVVALVPGGSVTGGATIAFSAGNTVVCG